MFNNLIESTSNSSRKAQKSALFGITAVVNSLLFLTVFVWSIFSFDLSAMAREDALTFNTLIAPAAISAEAPPPTEPNKPQQTVSQDAPKNFDVLRDPVENINKPTAPPQRVSTEKSGADEIRENVPYIQGNTKSRANGNDENISPTRDGSNSNETVALAPKQQTPIDDGESAPKLTPQPKPSPVAVKKITTVTKGVINGIATDLPKPAYPPAAKLARISGAVNVQVLIDESGKVVSATAVSGHPFLRTAATSAARQARFTPTKLSDQPVKVTGVIVYNFAP